MLAAGKGGSLILISSPPGTRACANLAATPPPSTASSG